MTIKFIGSPNFDTSRKPIKQVVIHWMVGTLKATDAVFQDKIRNTSAHYGVEDEIIHQYVKHVILIGEAAPMIAALLPPERYAHAFSMENAVNLARELARSGDCVLLSPACASFDQFRDYQHRGDVFMHCVRQERMLQ